MLDDRWREPPDEKLLVPFAWLMSQQLVVRVVLLGGYWSVLAVAGAFLGLSPLSGILGSFILLGSALGVYAALIAVRRLQWEDARNEALWRPLGWLLTGATIVAMILVVVMPAIVFLALAAWMVVLLPLSLLRG